jgi:hypothetical protein
VWAIIDTELPVPPTGKPLASSSLISGPTLANEVRADGEPDVALGEAVGDVAQLADRVDVHLPLRAGAHGPHLVAGMRDVVQNAGARPVVVLPVAVILDEQRVQELPVVRHAALDCPPHLGLAHFSSTSSILLRRTKRPRVGLVSIARGRALRALASPRSLIRILRQLFSWR